MKREPGEKTSENIPEENEDKLTARAMLAYFGHVLLPRVEECIADGKKMDDEPYFPGRYSASDPKNKSLKKNIRRRY